MTRKLAVVAGVAIVALVLLQLLAADLSRTIRHWYPSLIVALVVIAVLVAFRPRRNQ
jgi:hypothetical protein